jgi:diguanylate cyclase (GGDEF)-like protein
LVGRFAIASALVMLGVWVVLGRVEADRTRDRAMEAAVGSAVLLAEVGLQSHLTPADIDGDLDPTDRAQLDETFAAAFEGGRIARIKIWAPDGRIVYSDESALIGRSFEVEEDLEEALGGEIHSGVSTLDADENVNERSFGTLLEVYVPIRFDGGDPVGVFELYVPYEPIARETASDATRLYLLLLGALALLWLVLFRIVLGASRRLRRDGKELERRADENRYLALHDQLTDLPNRLLFRDRLEQAIRVADRDGTMVAVLVLDLDRFKEVNDTLGHEAGDELLVEVGPRLRSTLRGVDTVARLGGDEFGILLGGLDDAGEAGAVARKLAEALDEPFPLQSIQVALGASIGIAAYPTHAMSADDLMRRAEVAMYVAKAGRSPFEFYVQEQDHYTKDRLALVAELREAIDGGQITLHYQPKVDVADGRVIGVEALARWTHPTKGAIGPDAFIPLAEQSGLIRRLTSLVVTEALGQVGRWRTQGLDLTVAVNLSMRDLLDPALPGEIEASLERAGLPAGVLELEITEGSVMDQPARAEAVLARLSTMGVALAIDDFGTGYSSLTYLQRLPVSELKIDRSFVMRLTTSDADAEIVRSTIDLGHNLGLVVVAEGVEDEPSLAFLRDARCDVAQGFHIGRPMRADDVEPWVRAFVTDRPEVVGRVDDRA